MIASSVSAQVMSGHIIADGAASQAATPMRVVREMLRAANVGSADTVYDLGSGDGRIVVMAAQKFKSRAVGVEIDEKLVRNSTALIQSLRLDDRARIVQSDMLLIPLHDATVVTLYQFAEMNERLRPILEKQLQKGSRVVAHDFEIPGWVPSTTRTVLSENGLPHRLYVYVR